MTQYPYQNNSTNPNPPFNYQCNNNQSGLVPELKNPDPSIQNANQALNYQCNSNNESHPLNPNGYNLNAMSQPYQQNNPANQFSDYSTNPNELYQGRENNSSQPPVSSQNFPHLPAMHASIIQSPATGLKSVIQPPIPPSSFQQPSIPQQHSQQPPVPPQSSQQPSMMPQSFQQPPVPPQSSQQPSMMPPSFQQPPVPPQSSQQPSMMPQSFQQPPVPPQSFQQPPVPQQSSQHPFMTPQSFQQPPIPPQSSQQPSMMSQSIHQPPTSSPKLSMPPQNVQQAPQNTQQPPMPQQSYQQPPMPPQSFQQTPIPLQNINSPPMQNNQQQNYQNNFLPETQSSIQPPNNVNQYQQRPSYPDQYANGYNSGATNPQAYPEPILMTSGKKYSNHNDYYSNQGCKFEKAYRDPNMRISLDDWEKTESTCSLTYEKNILPLDGFDQARCPKINTKVNCDPNILRCTLTSIPSSAKLLSKCRLPLGLLVQPFRDLNSLCVLQTKNIVRCRNCRTYINPFVQFRDNGRRWQCSVCLLNNAIPDDFFFDPVTQTHGDPTRRPEIKSTTIEYIATNEYMGRPPQAPTYIFCLNANREAMITGGLKLACERISSKLMDIPGDSRRQVVIITYDSAIHFYKLNGEYPQEMVCPDVDDVFVPDMEGIFCPLETGMEMLDDLLTQIPESFSQTKDTGNCLGAVIQIALKMLNKIGGRITIVNCSIPNIGPGMLTNRDEGTDRLQPDSKKLQPAVDFYKHLALECSTSQVAVDIFALNNLYSDLATISNISRFSSGHLYYYPNFNYIPTTNEKDNLATMSPEEYEKNLEMISTWKTTNAGWIEAERFKRDFNRYLSRKIGFDAVMRTRYTRGLGINCFHGSQFVRSVDLLSLPNLSPDAGFGIQLEISEDITDPYVVIQVALLYTSSKCDRRIRVHTLCLPVVHTVIDVFKGADQGAIATLLGKMAVERCISSSLANAREALINAVADAVKAYNDASNNGKQGVSSMILPSNLRLLPLYVFGLLKCPAFRNHISTSLDERSASLEFIKCSPICQILPYIYPRLYPIDQLFMKDDDLTLLDKVKGLKIDSESHQDTADHTTTRSESSFEDTMSTSSDEEEEEEETTSDKATVLSSQKKLPFVGPMRLTCKDISQTGIYLMDQGSIILIMVSLAVSPEVLQAIFDVNSINEFPKYGIASSLPLFTEKRNNRKHPTKRAFIRLISGMRKERTIGNSVFIMRQDGPAHMKTRFLNCLIEDRSESSMSYSEFLQSIQAECSK